MVVGLFFCSNMPEFVPQCTINLQLNCAKRRFFKNALTKRLLFLVIGEREFSSRDPKSFIYGYSYFPKNLHWGFRFVLSCDRVYERKIFYMGFPFWLSRDRIYERIIFFLTTLFLGFSHDRIVKGRIFSNRGFRKQLLHDHIVGG